MSLAHLPARAALDETWRSAIVDPFFLAGERAEERTHDYGAVNARVGDAGSISCVGEAGNCRVAVVGRGEDFFATIGAEFRVDGQQGKFLEVRVSARPKSGRMSARLVVSAPQRTRVGALSFNNIHGNEILGDEPVSRVFLARIPQDVSRLTVSALFHGDGAAEIDAIQLRVVDRECRSDSRHAYLQGAIDQIERLSVRKRELDWAELRREAECHLLAGAGRADEHSVISRVLRGLRDGHSNFFERSQDILASSPTPSLVSVSDGIGRVVLQQFAAASQAEVDQEAVRLRDAISQGRAAADLGWIVDLRSFSGGGMWAAVAGLGELLGSPSKVGSFRNGEGAEYEWWVSCSGAGLRSLDTTSTLASAQAADCTPARKPVAMLIGPMTASAGEGVAVAFRGMPRGEVLRQPDSRRGDRERSGKA